MPATYLLSIIYCLCLLSVDMPGRVNCLRFPNMLPKLVVFCPTQTEDALSPVGYIASSSRHPDLAYFCEVCNFDYRDEVWKAFAEPSLSLRLSSIVARDQYETSCQPTSQLSWCLQRLHIPWWNDDDILWLGILYVYSTLGLTLMSQRPTYIEVGSLMTARFGEVRWSTVVKQELLNLWIPIRLR